MAIDLKGNGRIERLRSKGVDADAIWVPHRGKSIPFVFIYDDHRRREYPTKLKELDAFGLVRPTVAQVFSLIDLVLQNQDETDCRDILKHLSDEGFLTTTVCENSDDGTFIYEDYGACCPRHGPPHNRNFLASMLNGEESRDGNVKSVRLVPRGLCGVLRGFKTGEQSLSEFIRNPFVIAMVGEDMIPTVERVAGTLGETSGLSFNGYGYGFGPKWFRKLSRKDKYFSPSYNHYGLIELHRNVRHKSFRISAINSDNAYDSHSMGILPSSNQK